MKNYAFIDGQNLYLGTKDMGWKVSYRKFRTYLADQLGVVKAYYFIGFDPTNNDVYKSLQSAGFILMFKPTYKDTDGKRKGNVDADIVLQAMIDFDNYEKAVIVSGDGDFYSLVKYLRKQDKLRLVLAPNLESSSFLLRKEAKEKFYCIEELKKKLRL